MMVLGPEQPKIRFKHPGTSMSLYKARIGPAQRDWPAVGTEQVDSSIEPLSIIANGTASGRSQGLSTWAETRGTWATHGKHEGSPIGDLEVR